MHDVIALFYRKYGRFWVRRTEYNILGAECNQHY